MSRVETVHVPVPSSQRQPTTADRERRLNVASSQSAKSATDVEDYPLEALGDVLGPIAKEIHKCVQCPKGIAGQSILAAAALASQGHYNIEIDGRLSPLSLYCLTSGKRRAKIVCGRNCTISGI